jgi:hypothetical protein
MIGIGQGGLAWQDQFSGSRLRPSKSCAASVRRRTD